MINIYTYILMGNILALFLFGADKLLSKNKGKKRIPEIVFHMLSLIFCSFGIALGMIMFNHKTNKMSFRMLVPVFIFVNAVLMYDDFRFLKYVLNRILVILG